MRTKSAFLALPFSFSLGLVLALLLTACPSSSSNEEKSSSSAAMSSENQEDPTGSIRWATDLKVEDSENEVLIYGTVATAAGHIIKLTFEPSNLVWYENSQISTKTWSATEGPASISFSQKETKIKLTDASIPCGNNTFKVTICAADVETCLVKTQDFTKPQKFCQPSSSSVEQSSSSQPVWKFGAANSINLAKGETAIGTEGVKIELKETDDGDIEAKITGGQIRYAGVSTSLDAAGQDGGPVASREYPSTVFKDMGQLFEKVDLTTDYFYFIYAGTGKKYLIQIKLSSITPPLNPNQFPKPTRWWEVTESP